MKIYVEKGVVYAQAETEKDVVTLLAMKEVKQERGSYKRECPHCHVKYRGLKLHIYKAHNQRGINYSKTDLSEAIGRPDLKFITGVNTNEYGTSK